MHSFLFIHSSGSPDHWLECLKALISDHFSKAEVVLIQVSSSFLKVYWFSSSLDQTIIETSLTDWFIFSFHLIGYSWPNWWSRSRQVQRKGPHQFYGQWVGSRHLNFSNILRFLLIGLPWYCLNLWYNSIFWIPILPFSQCWARINFRAYRVIYIIVISSGLPQVCQSFEFSLQFLHS